MAGSKIPDLTALTTMEDADLFPVQDISDLTQGSSGTTKKITKANALGEVTKRIIGVQAVDAATNTATGDAKAFVRIPAVMSGWNLIAVAAHVYTAGTTGTTDVQLRRTRSGSSVDMLSTKITIDSTEVDSITAATQPVINASNDDVQAGDIISVDVDAVSSTAAKGLFVEMTFQKP